MSHYSSTISHSLLPLSVRFNLLFFLIFSADHEPLHCPSLNANFSNPFHVIFGLRRSLTVSTDFTIKWLKDQCKVVVFTYLFVNLSADKLHKTIGKTKKYSKTMFETRMLHRTLRTDNLWVRRGKGQTVSMSNIKPSGKETTLTHAILSHIPCW